MLVRAFRKEVIDRTTAPYTIVTARMAAAVSSASSIAAGAASANDCSRCNSSSAGLDEQKRSPHRYFYIPRRAESWTREEGTHAPDSRSGACELGPAADILRRKKILMKMLRFPDTLREHKEALTTIDSSTSGIRSCCTGPATGARKLGKTAALPFPAPAACGTGGSVAWGYS